MTKYVGEGGLGLPWVCKGNSIKICKESWLISGWRQGAGRSNLVCVWVERRNITSEESRDESLTGWQHPRSAWTGCSKQEPRRHKVGKQHPASLESAGASLSTRAAVRVRWVEERRPLGRACLHAKS